MRAPGEISGAAGTDFEGFLSKAAGAWGDPRHQNTRRNPTRQTTETLSVLSSFPLVGGESSGSAMATAVLGPRFSLQAGPPSGLEHKQLARPPSSQLFAVSAMHLGPAELGAVSFRRFLSDFLGIEFLWEEAEKEELFWFLDNAFLGMKCGFLSPAVEVSSKEANGFPFWSPPW